MQKLLDADIKSLIDLKDVLESNKPENDKSSLVTNMKDRVKASKKQFQAAKEFMKQPS